MAAKEGNQHHTRIKLAQDQASVLKLVAEGTPLEMAVVQVGRKREVLRNWLKDPKFASRLEEATSIGANTVTASMHVAEDKKIDYATF